jgi:queuosine precursor transporter
MPTSSENKNIKFYLPLLYLGIFYITAMIAADLLTYKMVSVFGQTISLALIIFPLTYAIGDITAEVFGKSVAIRLVLVTLLADFFIDTALSLSTHVSSPEMLSEMTKSITVVFSPLQHVFWGNLIGISIGSIANVTLMSKLKSQLHSQYFILRSIVSTLCGEIIYTIIAYSIWFVGRTSLHNIEIMIAVSMSFKLFFAALSSIPSLYISRAILARKDSSLRDQTLM